MATTITVGVAGAFADGATVGAYPASRWAGQIPSGTPIGSATDTDTVASQSVSFTGLTAGTSYYCTDATGTRYIGFVAEAAATGVGTTVTVNSVEVNPLEITTDVTAADIAFVPAGGIAATNVQTAIEEAKTDNDAGSQVAGIGVPIAYGCMRVDGAAGAPGSNIGRFSRIICPRAGTLAEISYFVGVSSGNVKFLIYDVGAASGGNYSNLYASASTPVGTVNTWQILTGVGLTVTRGQEIMVGLVFDNGTATFGRGTNLISAAGGSMPTGWTAGPGSIPLVVASGAVSFASVPATLSDGTLAGTTAPPIVGVKIT